MNESKSILRNNGLTFVATGLMALGIILPVIKNSNGYTYSIVGTPSYVIFAIIAASVIAVIFVAESHRAKLSQVNLLAYLGICGYAIYIANSGLDWFYYQTAYDMPGWASTDQATYWSLLKQMSGVGTTMFGDLQSLYALWGPGVELNGNPIFQNAINGLSLSDVKKLTSQAGGIFTYYPYGLAPTGLGVLVQGFICWKVSAKETA